MMASNLVKFLKVLSKLRNLGVYFYVVILIGILIYFTLQIGELSRTEIK